MIGYEREFHHSVLDFMQAIGDRTGKAMTLFTKATIQEKKEEFITAQNLFEQALSIDKSLKTPNIKRDQNAILRIQNKILRK